MKAVRSPLASATIKKAGPATALARPEKVALMVRLTAPDRKALRRIAVEYDTTVQALMEKAAKDIIRRHEA